MWLLPLLVVGFALYASGRARGERERGEYRQPMPAQVAVLPAPGPLAVLGELVRLGHQPPPTVIMCAIAEAETIGRFDVRDDIVRIFIAPVVYAQQAPAMAPMSAPIAMPTTPSTPSTPSMLAISAPGARTFEMPTHVQHRVYPPVRQTVPAAVPYERGSCRRPAPQSPRETFAPAPSAPVAPSAPASAPVPRDPSIDELQQMLDADPEGTMEMIAQTTPVPGVPAPVVNQPSAHDEPVEMIVGAVPQMPIEQRSADAYGIANLMHTPSIDTYRAQHPSPIASVSDGAWEDLCNRLVREAPDFQSAKHVGRYRQRRGRLSELGIDPNAIVGIVDLQREALDIDLADAYRHAVEGEFAQEVVGHAITLPSGESTTVTLSGMLGVIQAAGLEGAVPWFNSYLDRKRFPHYAGVRALQRSLLMRDEIYKQVTMPDGTAATIVAYRSPRGIYGAILHLKGGKTLPMSVGGTPSRPVRSLDEAMRGATKFLNSVYGRRN